MFILSPPVLLAAGALLWLLPTSKGAPTKRQDELPTVDLGRVVQRATSYDPTFDLYTFSNLRYGAKPLGERRFRPPVEPDSKVDGIQNGSYGFTCFQGNDAEQNPPQGEDCLFLDITVPRTVFEKKTKAAVLFWIHGGGYVFGSKTSSGYPGGLIERSREFGDGDGLIFVSVNYRLGAFGFIAGSTIESDGTANAGFLDQRLALRYVQKHIQLWGGDPSRVTIMGESAGGGSVVHQLILNDEGTTPFKRAISQSAGWQPIPSKDKQESQYQSMLELTGTSSLADLRTAPADSVVNANRVLQGRALTGTYAFSPVFDGKTITDAPSRILSRGLPDPNIGIMAAHNTNEGNSFTPQGITTDEQFSDWIKQLWPYITSEQLDYISNTLYPPTYDGAPERPYTSPQERLTLFVSETFFSCNAYGLGRAAGGASYNYVFGVGRGRHGDDIGYTFYNDGSSTSVNVDRALALQRYIVSFAQGETPSASGAPDFPQYGDEGRVVQFVDAGVSIGVDPAQNARCRWWAEGHVA